MKKTNTSIIENEFQHRGASLEKGLSIKALRPFYEEIDLTIHQTKILESILQTKQEY